MDHIFLDDQISIPEEFPTILKDFAKSAIKTNPTDLLNWSLKYFTALSKGEKPPGRERLKFDKPKNYLLTSISKSKMADKNLEKKLAENMALSALDYACTYNIEYEPGYTRLSKIVCTIGPATDTVESLVQMIEAGMNVARLNFSHGTYDYHANVAKNVREAAKVVAERNGLESYPIGIALDTKGPEIRTGLVEGGENEVAELKKGSKVKVTTDEKYFKKCSSDLIYIDYKNITKVLKEGNKIYIDDGQITLSVKQVGSDWLECEVENDSKLGNQKGCNLPGVETDLPAVSERDKEDLLFGIELNVDMIFASFIRNAQGVKEMRDILGEKGKNILIIPKIETDEGCRKIDEIIEVSDGIMVARGDLGINIPTEKIFLAQKMMIAKCNIVGKPVICATQMLQSMVNNPRPTRAESCDVANAVLDGADCVMLSGESASGSYPVICVQALDAICNEAEIVLNQRTIFSDLMFREIVPTDLTASTAIAAVGASLKCLASAIIVLTKSGRSAYLAAKFRPRCPIIAVTRDGLVTRHCQLRRAIIAVQFTREALPDWKKDVEARMEHGIKVGKQKNILKSGDTVVIMTWFDENSEFTDSMHIINVQ